MLTDSNATQRSALSAYPEKAGFTAPATGRLNAKRLLYDARGIKELRTASDSEHLLFGQVRSTKSSRAMRAGRWLSLLKVARIHCQPTPDEQGIKRSVRSSEESAVIYFTGGESPAQG